MIAEPLQESINDLRRFREMVETIIDRERLTKGEYWVAPTFDEQLAELRQSMRELEETIDRQLAKCSRDLGLTTVKLEYVGHLGYHLRLTLKEEANIRKRKEYKVLDAIKGGVRFTTDRLSALNEEHRQAKACYEEQQQQIVAEIVRVSSTFCCSQFC